VLEIDADAFRAYVHSHPAVVDQLASAAALRRQELDASRTSVAAPALAAERTSLAKRMRKFFGLD
jgi:CRP-like cAMP-binding protein